MIKVILLNGSAESGKDYFVNSIRKEAAKHAVSICHLSTILPVKEACEFSFAVSPEPKTEAKRLLWHKIKAALTEYNNGPFKDAVAHIESLHAIGCQHIVFLDVREPEEIEKFKRHYGEDCISLLIRRQNQYVPDNPADKNVESFQYDITIQNDGTPLFKQEAVRFLQLVAEKNDIKIAA